MSTPRRGTSTAAAPMRGWDRDLAKAVASGEWLRLCTAVLAGVRALGGLPKVRRDGTLVESGKAGAAAAAAVAATGPPGVVAPGVVEAMISSDPTPDGAKFLENGEWVDELRRLYVYNAGLIAKQREDDALLSFRRDELVQYHGVLHKIARGLTGHRSALQGARASLAGGAKGLAGERRLGWRHGWLW